MTSHAPESVTTIAVVSDTHLPRGRAELPEEVAARVSGADLVIHAGDFTTPETLERFRHMGPPLVAVHGNADTAEVRDLLPATATVTCGHLTIGVVHNGGPEAGRLARLRKRFPDCDLVIFGHSHIPLLAEQDGFTILNPGSAADRRRQPQHSLAMITVADGTAEITLLRVDPPVGPLPADAIRTAR